MARRKAKSIPVFDTHEEGYRVELKNNLTRYDSGYPPSCEPRAGAELETDPRS